MIVYTVKIVWEKERGTITYGAQIRALGMRNIIQVLLVLGMFATVAGIIGPLVLKVRVAAARTSCANNLHLIGGTLQDYHGSYERYPGATVAKTQLPPEQRLSWLTIIFPFIEAGPRLRLNESEPWNSPDNFPPYFDASKTGEPAHPVGLVKLFYCPGTQEMLHHDEVSKPHYIGIAGVGKDAASRPLGAPGIGFFGYDRVLRKQDITDGLGNTLTIMESFQDLGPWTAGGPATVRGLTDRAERPYIGPDGQWCSKHPVDGFPSFKPHITCVNAAFADGHVQILTERIDPSVLEALATIAGGETVSLDDLP